LDVARRDRLAGRGQSGVARRGETLEAPPEAWNPHGSEVRVCAGLRSRGRRSGISRRRPLTPSRRKAAALLAGLSTSAPRGWSVSSGTPEAAAVPVSGRRDDARGVWARRVGRARAAGKIDGRSIFSPSSIEPAPLAARRLTCVEKAPRDVAPVDDQRACREPRHGQLEVAGARGGSRPLVSARGCGTKRAPRRTCTDERVKRGDFGAAAGQVPEERGSVVSSRPDVGERVGDGIRAGTRHRRRRFGVAEDTSRQRERGAAAAISDGRRRRSVGGTWGRRQRARRVLGGRPDVERLRPAASGLRTTA